MARAERNSVASGATRNKGEPVAEMKDYPVQVVTCEKCGPIETHDPVLVGIRKVQVRLKGFPKGLRAGPQYSGGAFDWCKKCRAKFKSAWRYAR